MSRVLMSSETLGLYDILEREARLRPRYRVELQNLATHCNYHSFVVDECELEGVELVVVTPRYPVEQIANLMRSAVANGTTVVILHPENRADRREVCDRVVVEHRSTTVRRADYLLIFNNHLPKQHFEL